MLELYILYNYILYNLRIIITGGHHSCALVVAKDLVKKGHQIFWLGHKYSMWGDKNVSAEYLEVSKAKIPFFELQAGKFQKTLNLFKLVRLPLGFVQALFYLLKIKPELIVSFGGYLAVPVVIVGWILRIPSVTHEQTMVAGLGNKLISLFVKKIFISWPQKKKYYPSKKTVLTGLPLRKEIFIKKTKKYEFKEDLPTVYVTGGKQGSHVINQAVFEVLDKLLEKYNVIHQCGLSSLHNDYQIGKGKREKGKEKWERYKVVDYIFPEDIGAVFAEADLVVGRAGAHIIYELAALGKPAVLIPLPILYGDEQTGNAKLLEEIGLAKILPQKDLTGESLYQCINLLIQNIEKYKKAGGKAKKLVILDATEKIIREIENPVSNPG